MGQLELIKKIFRELRDLLITYFQKKRLSSENYYIYGPKEYENFKYEENVTLLVKKIINRFDLFINIGANYGYYSLISLNRGIKTISFEPISSNFKILLKNIYINSFQNNSELYPFALSSSNGIKKIYGSGSGASIDNKWKIPDVNYFDIVYTSTIDTIVSNRYNAKKHLYLIDVEGHELEVIKGGLKSLGNKNFPVLIIEIVNFHHTNELNPDFERTFLKLWGLGFKSFGISNNLFSFDKTNISKIIDKGELFEVYDYIFIHEEDHSMLQFLNLD